MNGVNLSGLGLGGFDSSQVEPNSFDNLPAGNYLAMITDSVVKPTKAGNGQYIELTFEIVDGQYAGRKFWDRLNVDNPNVTAREISLKTLSSLARAVGIFGALQNTVMLHDRPISVNISYKGDDARYRYAAPSAVSGGAPAAAAGAPAQQQGSPRPWETQR